jgi:SAM-dependent methyltransferase
VTASHWEQFHRRWARIKAPLRPNAEIVAAFEAALAGHSGRVLLLGVTPELADLGRELVAVDRNAAMIENVWPGDLGRRRAQAGDWLDLRFPQGHFTAVIGDGSLSLLAYPAGHRALYAQLEHILKPGGRAVFRTFATPEEGESVDAVADRAWAGRAGNFHGFKWQLAMAVVSGGGDANIGVTAIRDVFNIVFPDRNALSAATGWSLEDIATIDVYENSPDVYSFATLSQLRAVVPKSFPRIYIEAVGSYPLADRCPFLVLERAA